MSAAVSAAVSAPVSWVFHGRGRVVILKSHKTDGTDVPVPSVGTPAPSVGTPIISGSTPVIGVSSSMISLSRIISCPTTPSSFGVLYTSSGAFGVLYTSPSSTTGSSTEPVKSVVSAKSVTATRSDSCAADNEVPCSNFLRSCICWP